MKKEEYDLLEKLEKVREQVITSDSLKDKTDRTLLFGYTCERATWHVYIKDNRIYTVIYNYGKEPILRNVNSNRDYVPDKRLYPECCDYEFCKILKRLDVHLPFTIWEDRPEQRQYWGKTL